MQKESKSFMKRRSKNSLTQRISQSVGEGQSMMDKTTADVFVYLQM